MKLLQKIKKNPMVLNAFAMLVIAYCANTRCMWMGYQPEMPDDIKQFRKF